MLLFWVRVKICNLCSITTSIVVDLYLPVVCRSGIAYFDPVSMRPHPIPDTAHQNALLVPSVIAIDLNGKVYVGQAAINMKEKVPPQNFLHSFKRLVGKTYV